jgi:Protein of unknown function (DUF2811)
MNTSVSIMAEIPEILHQSLQQYLETHPSWDQDGVFTAALSFFLLNCQSSEGNTFDPQNGCAKVYLETLFQRSEC